jgi:putative flippase GtrA
MTPPMRGFGRLFRYSVVGSMGLALKFCILTGLVELAGTSYLPATACAVEAAVLHNFVWHLRWTWRDRSTNLSLPQALQRLLKFHLGIGAVAMVVNLLVMRLLVDYLRIHYLLASVAATISAGLATFMISNFFVFVSAARPVTYRT